MSIQVVNNNVNYYLSISKTTMANKYNVLLLNIHIIKNKIQCYESNNEYVSQFDLPRKTIQYLYEIKVVLNKQND